MESERTSYKGEINSHSSSNFFFNQSKETTHMSREKFHTILTIAVNCVSNMFQSTSIL